jgi:hypothetical protein
MDLRRAGISELVRIGCAKSLDLPADFPADASAAVADPFASLCDRD